MTKVQIAVATDMRMFEPTLTAMMSAVEHSSRPVMVHFFGHGLSSNAQKMLDRAIRCWPETELLFYDIFGKETGDEDTEWDGRHSVAMHAPLHISRLVKEGRVLYLDSDTITQADIAPLFEIDMKGCHIAAARDYGFLSYWCEFQPKGLRTAIAKALLHLVMWNKGKQSSERGISAGRIGKFEGLMRYYSTGKNPPFSGYRRRIYPYPIYDFPNTGVVLFDVDSIKSEPGLVYALVNPVDIEDDTSRIIEVLKGRILILDPCWNALCGIYHLYSDVHEAIVLDGSQYVHEDAKIVHHVGLGKPWDDYSLDDFRADPQKVRERVYSDLNLEAHGHPVSAVFDGLRGQKRIEEHCAQTQIWRESHDKYMGMLKT